jgi:hypothetical protein
VIVEEDKVGGFSEDVSFSSSKEERSLERARNSETGSMLRQSKKIRKKKNDP